MNDVSVRKPPTVADPSGGMVDDRAPTTNPAIAVPRATEPQLVAFVVAVQDRPCLLAGEASASAGTQFVPEIWGHWWPPVIWTLKAPSSRTAGPIRNASNPDRDRCPSGGGNRRVRRERSNSRAGPRFCWHAVATRDGFRWNGTDWDGSKPGSRTLRDYF